MKVTTDACLFGAWVALEIENEAYLKKKGNSILDIGTGTGLLGLMLAQKRSSPFIDAIEIDQDSYQQAKDNAEASPFTERLRMIHADVKKYHFEKKYDAIISNPPFYEKEINSVNHKRNVAHHQSGLVLEELLEIIKMNLARPGYFYLLLPFKRHEEIRKFFLRQNLFLSKIVFVRQSINHTYFRLMIAGKLNPGEEVETQIEEISIWDGQQQYTDQFKELLNDYYLNL